jgi:hypothetical protein
MDIEKEYSKLEKRARGWFICIVLIELVMALWFVLPKLQNMRSSYEVFDTVEYLNEQKAWYTQTVVDKVDASKNEVVVHPFNRDDLTFNVASYDASAYENGNTLEVFFKDQETPLCIRSEIEGRMRGFIEDLVKVAIAGFAVIISLFVFSSISDSVLNRKYYKMLSMVEDEELNDSEESMNEREESMNELDDNLKIIDLDEELC